LASIIYLIQKESRKSVTKKGVGGTNIGKRLCIKRKERVEKEKILVDRLVKRAIVFCNVMINRPVIKMKVVLNKIDAWLSDDCDECVFRGSSRKEARKAVRQNAVNVCGVKIVDWSL
jgi:hypothetical protein